MALRDQPYFPLYVQDFLTDEKLRECDPASVGVYSFIMCLMHKSEVYGTILLKQKDKQSEKQIYNFASKLVKHLPYTIEVIEQAITDLCDEQVLYINGDMLIQKRMVKDNNTSVKRSNSGKKGGKKTQQKLKNFALAKSEANSEYENEYENEINIDSFLNFKEVVSFFDKKNYNEKTWTECYSKLIRLDGYSEARILEIVKAFRDRENWWRLNGNFETLLKLRNKNKEKLKYIDVFDAKLKSQTINNYTSEELIN